MPNVQRQPSYKRKRPVIGVLSGWQVYERAILQNYLGPLLNGIRFAAQSRECNLLLACGVGRTITLDFDENRPVNIMPAWPVPSPESDFVPIGPWNTDGLIVVNPLMSTLRAEYILDIKRRGHPVAFVGTALGGPAIGIDNQAGVRAAVQHLVEHGHRSIAFIAGIPEDVSGDSGERLAAYLDAVCALGLNTDPRLIVPGFHSVDGGRQAMSKILNSSVACTALVTCSDEAAFGAISAIKAAGLQIPKDMAVIGFDDQPQAIVQEPPLTSVHSLTFERGYRSVELLFDCIEGRRRGDELVVVPAQLTIRQSCGCFAADMPPSGLSTENMLQEQNEQKILERLANDMADALLKEVRLLSIETVHMLCLQLVRMYVSSLKDGNASFFRASVADAIQTAERAGENAQVWEAALSVLRSGTQALLISRDWLVQNHILARQAYDLLHEALLKVSQSVQRSHHRYILNQHRLADRFALFSSRLLSALDEEQIFDILANHLPDFGIVHAEVVLFEPDGSNSMGWSVLHTLRDGLNACHRFPSREFPPPGLYTDGELTALALLPLKIDEQQVGYVAFDAANLEINGQLVYQLAIALKIARLYQQATEGQRLAEEANRMKGRLLSVASHELRTPLNLIVGLSELMLKDRLEYQRQLSGSHWQDIERIHASAKLLDGLIRDVLDLSRSEAGQLKLTIEVLNLEDVLSVVATLGEQLCADQGLAWKVEKPAHLPSVWGDRTRLRQVLLNLINNAVKFTSQGEVVLKVLPGDTTVTFVVQDTGLGIAPDEQELIFDEFRQSERTSARGYGGLGLGLAICKRLVELQGGQIGVSSSGREGDGSSFFFTLPVVTTSFLQVLQTLPEPSVQPVALLTPSQENCQLLCDYLISQGFLIQTILVDEQETWLARLLENRPTTIILDVGLNSVEGWGTLRRLKGHPDTQNIPVLFYALTVENDRGSILDMDYLTKPIGVPELMQALERQGLAPDPQAGTKTILVVDDDPEILAMHARIVEMQLPSYRVSKACNGRQALLQMRQEKPALVLLDLMMPEMDGFSVLETIQEDEALRSTPVIVLTGQDLTEQDLARLNRGVSKVLRKGLFSVAETLAHVETALARKQGLAHESQRLVRKAMAYIHKHYAEPITRDDVADYVGINSDYLTRLFKQEMGVPLVNYLNRLRITHAKTLLADGEKNIAEVADLVGFSSSSYFCRVFRRETGQSPGDYQQTRTA